MNWLGRLGFGRRSDESKTFDDVGAAIDFLDSLPQVGKSSGKLVSYDSNTGELVRRFILDDVRAGGAPKNIANILGRWDRDTSDLENVFDRYFYMSYRTCKKNGAAVHSIEIETGINRGDCVYGRPEADIHLQGRYQINVPLDGNI